MTYDIDVKYESLFGKSTNQNYHKGGFVLTHSQLHPLGWPLVLVFSRFFAALILQILIAVFFFFFGSPEPLETAGRWFTVYGSLIDLTCLFLITRQLRKEQQTLRSLFQGQTDTAKKTVGVSLLYVVIFLPMSVLGMSVGSWLLYGTPVPQQTMGGLPLWAAIYSVTLWPFLWAFAEQVTYQGYALPRLLKEMKHPWMAIAIVTLGWAIQHVALPLHLDWRYMTLRFVSFVPVAVVMMLFYLRTRRLKPFIIAHWFMDLAAVISSVLLPLFQ